MVGVVFPPGDHKKLFALEVAVRVVVFNGLYRGDPVQIVVRLYVEEIETAGFGLTVTATVAVDTFVPTETETV